MVITGVGTYSIPLQSSLLPKETTLLKVVSLYRFDCVLTSAQESGLLQVYKLCHVYELVTLYVHCTGISNVTCDLCVVYLCWSVLC